MIVELLAFALMLQPFQVDPYLVQHAQERADYLCEHELSHDQMLQGYDLAHARYSYNGEVLAQGFASAEEVQTAWIMSWPHLATLIDPRFTHIGIAEGECGVVVGSLGGKAH